MPTTQSDADVCITGMLALGAKTAHGKYTERTYSQHHLLVQGKMMYILSNLQMEE